MNISEIQKLENQRDASTMNRVHFIKEGNFYRAHDISAWLVMTHPFGEAIKNISITAKKLKDGYIDAFIGFPVTSIEKFIPRDGSVSFEPVSDVQIDVVVMLADDVCESPIEDIRVAVDEWKQTLPLKADKPDRREIRETGEHPHIGHHRTRAVVPAGGQVADGLLPVCARTAPRHRRYILIYLTDNNNKKGMVPERYS